MIDPNNEIPDWELSFRRTNPCSQSSTFSIEKDKKRAAEDSPENQKVQKRKKFVPEWQIGEFLWMFLEGTKTAPEYHEVNLENDLEATPTTDNPEESVDNTPDVEETPEATEAEENLDIK